MLGKQRSFYLFRLIADLLLLNFAFIFAAFYAQPPEILFTRAYMFLLLLILNLLWYLSSNATNYYDDFHPRNAAFQFIQIIKLSILSSLGIILFIFFVKEDLYTRNFILAFTLLFPAILFIRFVVYNRILISLREKNKYFRNLAIIGAGKVGKDFSETITANPSLVYNFIGFVDDSPSAAEDKLHLGSIPDLQEILSRNEIHEVIVALPNTAIDIIDRVVRVCNIAGVRIHIIPDMFKFLAKKYRISMIGDFPVITVRNEPLESIHWQLIKRTFDLVVSFLGLVTICSWLFPLIAVLQKLFSGGPVFFVQRRVGKEHKPFNCYKFRTMTPQNHDKKFIPTIPGDPRITRLGSILRKTNIDELPQLINVLIGDMSIVGPRPHAIAYDELYKEFIEELRLRNFVKPGITGWAQVHGLRGDVPDEEENKKRIQQRFNFDLWYVENWTFLLDIQIIFMTFWRILRGDVKGH